MEGAAPTAEALAAEHRRLDAAAARHKREAQRHRRAARAAREEQAEIERQCARLGISYTLTTGAGDPHGQAGTPSRP